MEAALTRRKRITLGVLGAIIVFLSAGPPDFAVAYVITGWQSDLDGGIHQLHLVARGVSTLLVALTGLVLIVKPAWSLGVAQSFIAKGAAFLFAGVIGQYFWPPVLIYPLFALIVVAAVLWAFRGRLPWQQPEGSQPPASKPMLFATAVIAVPLVIWALDQASLQRTAEVLHGDLGHWAGGTATAMIVIISMLFASRRMPGWRVPAWVAGATLFMVGFASAVMPNQASSFGVGWGIAAIAAAAGFVALAEYENRTEPAAATTPPVQPVRS